MTQNNTGWAGESPQTQHSPYRGYLATLSCGASLSLIVAAALFQFSRPFNATAAPERLAEIQSERPDSIVLPFDLRYNAAFKIRRLEIERPEIVWFGTSRAGSAMAEMFEPYRFYNMSFTGWTTDQLTEAFERATRTVRPRVAIISLDYFLFTDRWESQLRTSRQMIFNEPLRYLQSSLGNFVRSAVTHWTVFQDYARAPNTFIGPQTILVHEGFRRDGSWLFTQAHVDSAIRQFRNVDFLKASLPGAPEMSERQKAPIEQLTALAKERGIRLVGVQLPYIRAGVDFLDSRRDNDAFYGVWHDFESVSTRSWLAGLGIEFFNLSHSQIDDDPANFIDAYHPSELGMRKVIQELMNSSAFQTAISRSTSASR
jgi:hypothetical protein